VLIVASSKPHKLVTYTVDIKQRKAVPLPPCKRQGREEIAPTPSWPRHHMGLSQRHAPAALYTRGNALGTHWTEGCVGPSAGLDIEARGYRYQIAYSYTNMKIVSINAQHMFTLPPQLYRTYHSLYCVATWVKHSTVVPWYQRISSQRCSPLNSFGRRPLIASYLLVSESPAAGQHS
jgi:hypothetical protein